MSYLRHFLTDSPHPGFVWNAFWVVSMPIAFVFHCSSIFVIVISLLLLPHHNECAVSPSIPHGFPSSRPRSERILQCLECYSIRFYCQLRFHLRSRHRRFYRPFAPAVISQASPLRSPPLWAHLERIFKPLSIGGNHF